MICPLVAKNDVDSLWNHSTTRGSVGRACVTHLSFCFEEILYKTFHRCFLPTFKRTSYCGHISCMIGTKYDTFVQDFHTSFLQSNNSLCLLVSDRRFFKLQPVRNKNCPCQPCFLSNWDEMRKSYRKSSTDASLTNFKITSYCAHISCMFSTKYDNFVKDLPYIIPTK